MIEQKDLRPGNRVIDKDGDWVIVVEANAKCAIVRFEDMEVVNNYNDIDGIEVSVNEVKRLGFSELNPYEYHLKTKNFFLKWDPSGWSFVIHRDSQGMKFVRVKYIHEIQNLFYWLYREELTLS